MTAAAGAKTAASPFSNEEKVIKVVYDFAVDGGATGQLDLITADGDLVVTGFHGVVKTTCTSGGSAVVEVGDTNDDDMYAASLAVAGLTAGTVIKPTVVEGTPNVIPFPRKLADGESLKMKIETATLTAGVIEWTFKVQRL